MTSEVTTPTVAADVRGDSAAARPGYAEDGPSMADRRSGAVRESGRRGLRALNQYVGVLVVLVGLFVYLSITQGRFLSSSNFVNVLDTNAVTLIVSVGLTFVLLTGAIDLSLGGVIAVTATTLWELVTKTGLPVAVDIVAVIALAFLLGFLVNGLLIGRVGLSFLVVTIASAYLFRGVANLRTGGQDQTLYKIPVLSAIGRDKFLGLPLTVWVSLAVLILGMAILRYTGYGRMVYAVGGNPEAARLAGINVAFVRMSVFGLSAGLAGLASVVDVSRTTSASPGAQMGIELIAGAAVLLGGTSFMGGKGTLLGTLFGVLFLGVLQNGLTLAGISSYWADVVSGAVLIAAIGFDRWRNGATG